MKRLRLLLVTTSLFFSAMADAAEPGYRIREMSVTNLGTLGGRESVALDLNMYGDIVGWSDVTSGRKHAFLRWSFGAAMVDISDGYGSFDTIATGINRHTDIVGTMTHPTTPLESHGFYRPLGTPTSQLEDVLMPEFADDCLSGSTAEAINDSGYITGTMQFEQDLNPGDPIECLFGSKAAFWSSPNAPALVAGSADGPQPEVGLDINNHNTVVGLSKANPYEALRWRANGAVTHVPPPAATPGYTWTVGVANGISDSDWIAGSYEVRINGTSSTHAIAWNGSSENSVDLGVLFGGSNSVATDVNEQRFVVGYSDELLLSPPALIFTKSAFIWHKRLGMVALPRLHERGECRAHAINRQTSGGGIQIAGYCVNGTGLRKAVRWDVNVQTN
jgi:probable HAF family extracellular repeat protein